MPLFEKFRFIFYVSLDCDANLYRTIDAELQGIFDDSLRYSCIVTTDLTSGEDEIAYSLIAYEDRIRELIKKVEATCHNLSHEPIFRGVKVYRRSLDGVFRWKWYYEDLWRFDQPWLFSATE